MSQRQMSRGIEMIESAAERTGLRLGSRATDLFRGVVRLSVSDFLLRKVYWLGFREGNERRRRHELASLRADHRRDFRKVSISACANEHLVRKRKITFGH